MSSSFMVFATLFCAANAATRTWTGVIDNQWTTANNWNPSGVPGPQDDVVINGNDHGQDTVCQLTSSAASVKSLTLGSSANSRLWLLNGLMVSGTATVGGNGVLELNSADAAISCNDVKVAGELRLESGSVLGNVEISGKANFGGSGAKTFNGANVKVTSAEDVTVLGTLFFQGNSTVTAKGSVVSQSVPGPAPFQLMFSVNDKSTGNSFTANGFTWTQ